VLGPHRIAAPGDLTFEIEYLPLIAPVLVGDCRTCVIVGSSRLGCQDRRAPSAASPRPSLGCLRFGFTHLKPLIRSALHLVRPPLSSTAGSFQISALFEPIDRDLFQQGVHRAGVI
jgi:hypothetical protein